MALTGGQGKVKFSQIEGEPSDNAALDAALDSAGGGGSAKVYCAFLGAGALFPPVVRANTTGATVTVTNPSSGLIRLTFSSAVLTANKVSVIPVSGGEYPPYGAGATEYHVSIASTTVINLYCSVRYSDGTGSNQDYPTCEVTVTIY